MSRGLGILQRRVCEVLEEAKGRALPLRELRRRVGDPDRSNLRRAIRGLLERGIVEERPSEREPGMALTDWGIDSAGDRPATLLHSGDTVRAWRGESAGGVHWFGYERIPVRERPRARRSNWSSRRSARTREPRRRACRWPR